MSVVGETGRDIDIGLWSRMLDCTSLDTIERNVLEPLAGIIGADSAVYFSYHTDTQSVGKGVVSGLGDNSLASYGEYFHALDPLAVASRRLATGYFKPTNQHKDSCLVTQLCQLHDREAFAMTEYYNDFLKPTGIKEILAVLVPVRALAPEILCVGLHKSGGSGPYTAADVEKIRPHLPILRAALTNYALAKTVDAAALALDVQHEREGGFGIALMDENLNLLFATRQAKIELGLDSTQQLEHLRQATGPLARLSRRNARTMTQIKGTKGQSFDLEIEKRTLSDGRKRFVFNLLPAGANERLDRHFRAFGLSKREVEISRHILKGLNNESVAAQAGISIRTVENHLRSIYSKASVNSRTQLIARLLDLR